MNLSRVLPVAALSLLSSLAACASAPGEAPAEKTGRATSAVINGKPSDASQDAVILLVYYDPANRGFGQCTGTLLAPRLVLTARHCVGDTDQYAACRSDGTPIAAGEIRKNHRADAMYVFTGKDRPDFGSGRIEPAGQGMKILDAGGDNLCNNDIALVVLKEPVKNAQIAPIRLDRDVEVGELITAVGWGVTEDTPQPEQRQQRKNVKVMSVGPDKSEGSVPPNEFEVGESICSGDSGGPAIAQSTNAVVGVVSRGGNASGGDSNNPAANCIDGRNLYTKVTPFKDLIMKGFELAEAEPWLEGGPDPRLAKPKSACTEGSECRSGLCLADPDAADATTCAEDCSATDTCSVEGEVCTAEGDAKVCRAPKITTTTSSTSCASTGTGAGSVPGASLVFGLLALAGLRRRRR